jgi:hypothetical protein
VEDVVGHQRRRGQARSSPSARRYRRPTVSGADFVPGGVRGTFAGGGESEEGEQTTAGHGELCNLSPDHLSKYGFGDMGMRMWMWILRYVGALAFGQEARLVEIASGFARPVDIQQPDDGTNRLFIVEQAGTVRVIRDGAVVNIPVLDIRDRVTVIGGGDERGLPGLASRLDFRTNSILLNIQTVSGTTTVSRFRMNAAGADTADASSEHCCSPFPSRSPITTVGNCSLV